MNREVNSIGIVKFQYDKRDYIQTDAFGSEATPTSAPSILKDVEFFKSDHAEHANFSSLTLGNDERVFTQNFGVWKAEHDVGPPVDFDYFDYNLDGKVDERDVEVMMHGRDLHPSDQYDVDKYGNPRNWNCGSEQPDARCEAAHVFPPEAQAHVARQEDEGYSRLQMAGAALGGAVVALAAYKLGCSIKGYCSGNNKSSPVPVEDPPLKVVLMEKKSGKKRRKEQTAVEMGLIPNA